jgi:hypothetical protein
MIAQEWEAAIESRAGSGHPQYEKQRKSRRIALTLNAPERSAAASIGRLVSMLVAGEGHGGIHEWAGSIGAAGAGLRSEIDRKKSSLLCCAAQSSSWD